MTFVKGYKMSEEHKSKISAALRGKMPKNIDLVAGWNSGMKWTPEQRRKLTEARRNMSVEWRRNIGESKKGIISPNRGKKFPQYSGENHPFWISDRTKLAKKQERNDTAYAEWRKNVWIRDGFKCKISNGDCSGRIEAHHILNWSEFVELRYEINNGITLCHAHHPRKRAEEKRLQSEFQALVSVLNAVV